VESVFLTTFSDSHECHPVYFTLLPYLTPTGIFLMNSTASWRWLGWAKDTDSCSHTRELFIFHNIIYSGGNFRRLNRRSETVTHTARL